VELFSCVCVCVCVKFGGICSVNILHILRGVYLLIVLCGDGATVFNELKHVIVLDGGCLSMPVVFKQFHLHKQSDLR
jgi:hypothetical protein